jgi:uncharacterized tellurite resistance protein B-like protein
MINALKNLFSGTSPEQDSEDTTPELATAALMVEAALSDGDFAEVEQKQILNVLTTGFGLGQDDAEAMLSKAQELIEQAVDHYRFTRIVKELPHDKRVEMLTHLWSVVLADGENDAHEDALLRRLAPLLALSDHDRAHARQAAQRDL